MEVRSRQDPARRNRHRRARSPDDRRARAASPGRHEPVARSRSESRAYTYTELRHTGQRRADGAIRGYATREAKVQIECQLGRSKREMSDSVRVLLVE